jgi:DNA-binding transcriptional MerR regulator
MSKHESTNALLPPIPAKRYFTIGEVGDLCGVKPHVLRYWEQEFSQLKPVKRRGNRRYYQHHEVLLIRRIRELLYEQGFTISGARNRLELRTVEPVATTVAGPTLSDALSRLFAPDAQGEGEALPGALLDELRRELTEIAALLHPPVSR